ncbi:hypothetical protein PENTCL1PPCAC_23167, partial [Pristionchus entomophagus]
TVLVTIPQPSNTSVAMYDELTRLRLSLRGRQKGEKADIKMVLHVSMGIGDSNLPNHIAWLPALLCCFTTVSVLTVVMAVFTTNQVNEFMSESDNSTSAMARDHVSSDIDIILRKRKIENPHQPVETVFEDD